VCCLFYFLFHSRFFKGKVKCRIFGGFYCFFLSGFFKKTSDFIGWVKLHNTEDNYGRLIDFLSQISKLSNFNMLDLAGFKMHFLFPVSFFCANTVAHLFWQYVLCLELRH